MTEHFERFTLHYRFSFHLRRRSVCGEREALGLAICGWLEGPQPQRRAADTPPDPEHVQHESSARQERTLQALHKTNLSTRDTHQQPMRTRGGPDGEGRGSFASLRGKFSGAGGV